MSGPISRRPISLRQVSRAVPEARISLRDDVAIVVLEALRDPLPAVLVEELDALVGEGPVIVDLSDVALISRRPLEGLTGWLVAASDGADRCCVACPRATARALMSRWHVTRALAVFASTGDALQARALHLAGYGSGWHPDPLLTPRSDRAVDCLEAITATFQRHGRPAETD
jgi:hypothetical protein